MAIKFRVLTFAVIAACAAGRLSAQTIDLANGGADQLWRGASNGARAGFWLDQGPLSTGDSRRDLVVGAPGDGGMAGRVYVLYGGPIRTGSFVLSSAEATITGDAPGDGFGTSTAIGNITNLEGSSRRDIAVGAPGILNGRGRVYLFRGGLGQAASLTTANAVLTITGNTGDQLGAMLASADLNNDGYRDIVIGAPGTNRIYVINGSATLSGTIDLSTTAASSVITGAGIGQIITAGDVTGDEIYDLLIGAPTASNSRGAVYLVAGRATGGFPSSVSLPTDASALFTGIDANDLAGSSIRIADVDSDGRRDIVISAPGGDGPDGSRTDAGETYIIWGTSATVQSTSLSGAPVTLYGPSSSARLGAFVTAGDINRDTPNDLVLLAPGPANSTGQLIIYYGRNRSGIGTLQSDGRRLVDFAAPNQIDRVILSDASSGPLVAAQVFEVTGEGARDIIVSSPYATTDSGALSGYVYFTISPKLTLSRSSLPVGTTSGGTATGTFEIRNASSIPITWTVRSNQSWITVSPTSGSSVSGSPATLTVNVSAAGLPPGSYPGSITATSTSRDLEMSLPVNVTLNVVTTPSVTSNVAFPTPAGTPITFTASASGGSGSLEYKFWRYKVGSGWTMAKDYSTSNTLDWTPAPTETGDFVIQAWVRVAGSASSYDAYGSLGTFTISRAAPNVTDVTANVAFPTPPGQPITFTATSVGGIAPVQYKFWRYKASTGWAMIRDWASSASASWTPGASDEGSYTLQVWARNGGATGDPDSYRAMDFTIARTTPSVQSVNANRTFPSPTGAAITWTAIASGGTAGPLQFRFWRYNAGTGAWTLAQDYSASNTYTWTPSAGDAGSYLVQVWVRSAGSAASYEAYGSTPTFSIVRPTVTITSFGTTTAFPVSAGTTITWTAQATGGSGALEYLFYRYNSGTGVWSLVQSYGSSSSFTWTPSTAEKGTYVLQVWVRSVGSTDSYEAYSSTGYFTIQ